MPIRSIRKRLKQKMLTMGKRGGRLPTNNMRGPPQTTSDVMATVETSSPRLTAGLKRVSKKVIQRARMSYSGDPTADRARHFLKGVYAI